MPESKQKIEMWVELANEHFDQDEFEEALLLFTKAAKEGSAEAQYRLGELYETGEGMDEEDYEKALHWYKKAAEQGHYEAMCDIAKLYRDGSLMSNKIPVNHALAVEWFKKAARHAPAGDNYARREIESLTIEEEDLFDEAKLADKHYKLKEYDKAFPLYKKSAENGNVESQLQLGFMYAEGWGCKKNVDEAIKWLTKVARTGGEHADSAEDTLNDLREEVAAKQAQEAEERERDLVAVMVEDLFSADSFLAYIATCPWCGEPSTFGEKLQKNDIVKCFKCEKRFRYISYDESAKV